MPAASTQKLRFGPFELDRQSGELFKLGHKLNLHGQPIEVLSILLERPSEVVTREELCRRLWPEDTFVDFEHSLNTAIKKLRQTLDDDPDAPRFIETLPKKGYRFIAQVEAVPNEVEPAVDPAISPPTASASSSNAGQTVPHKSRRWPLAAAAIILVVAIVAVALYWTYRPRTLVVTSIHRLTRTGRHKAAGANDQLVTEGSSVYFDELSGDRWRIAQVPTKGGDITYVDIPSVKYPRLEDISDDGSELLVLDYGAATESPMWLFSLPNGPAREIPGLRVLRAKFLPGSKKIIYIQSDQRHLFTANVDGNQTRLLISTPGEIRFFAGSPDGTRIRFSSEGKLWESRFDGTRLHRFLPQLPQKDRGLTRGMWSADGKFYGFLTFGSGVDLWAVTESELGPYRAVSQPVQLTNGPISFVPWTPSRDGRQIFALGATLHAELVARDTQSGEFRKYLNGISAGYIDFSPDGQWMAYVSYPEKTLWRSRIDGTERLQLATPSDMGIIQPKWSPDGRLVVFTDWIAPSNKIYAVPADGGTPMLLLAGDFDSSDANWSSDGKSILYAGHSVLNMIGNLEGASEVRVLNLDTKQFKTIAGSQHMFSPRWSPDGRFIAALSDDTTKMFFYDFEKPGWKQVLVPTSAKPGHLGWPTWSHDRQYLYVAAGHDIYRARMPDGRMELAASIRDFEITDPLFGGNWFGLTPDDRIMVLRDRGTDELYALDLEYR